MSNNKTTEVIGIASGKGGVGKTTVSINLAVALAQRGHDVMLFDADLGLANAQIALGARAEYNLSHFLAGQKTLEEITITSMTGTHSARHGQLNGQNFWHIKSSDLSPKQTIQGRNGV